MQKKLLLSLALASCSLSAAPIQTLSGLTGVRFYELTSGVAAFTFAPNSSQMNTQAGATLNGSNSDFTGAPDEFYDVFFSNSDGTFNANGEFVSIEGYYGGSSAGLNIAEVELLFGAGPSLFASSVASFVPGVGFQAGNLNNIIDGNINTGTGMGTTDTVPMRVTVGFSVAPVNGVPEPSTWMLGIAGLGCILALRRR